MNKIMAFRIGIAMLSVIWTLPTMATEANMETDMDVPGHSEKLDLYGFVTQGFFKTTENNFYGSSKDKYGSFEFTELGVGAGFVASNYFSVGGTLISRFAGNADNGALRVDNLVFDIKAYRGNTSVTGVQLGRNKIPFGFYNATRDMALARPSMLLPQSVYYDHSRNFLINADGIDVYHERWDDSSYTKFDLLYETPNGVNNPQTEAYFLGMNRPGSLRSNYATGFVVNHRFNNDKTRFAAYVAQLPIEYVPGEQDMLSAGRITTDVAWLSFQHEVVPRITVTSEMFLPRIKYSGFGPVIPDRTVYPLGWYIQGTYSHSAKWEFYGRFDQSYKDKHDKGGIVNAAGTGRPSHAFYASDWTVGLNYFPSANVQLSAEFHHIKGTAFLPLLDNQDPSETRERWNMLGLQAAYRFR